ncbi:MAG: phage major capsid protein, partial [Planctomycetota bacterium]
MAITDAGGVDFSGDFYDHVLRNHFLPEVADGLNHDYILLERFASLKDKSMVQGKNVQHPVHEGRNPNGVGAVGVSGKLPTPAAQSYDEYQYPIRSQYGRIKFTGLAADSSASDIDSWLRAVDSELTGNRDDLSRSENRILHGFGSGIYGEITEADEANLAEQTVSFPAALEGSATMDTSAMDPTHFIEVGGLYSIYASADDDLVAGSVSTTQFAFEITAKTATTVTFSEIMDLVNDGDGPFFIVKANETVVPNTAAGLNSTSFAREAMGISGIVSDGNLPVTDGGDSQVYNATDNLTAASFQNVAVTAGTYNAAQILDNSSVRRPLTEALIQKGLSTVEKAFQGKIDCFISSFGIRDAFADLMLTYRRHVNKTELRAGFTTVAYGDIPIIPDRDAYPNRLIGLDEGDLRQHCLGSTDYRFIDEDGSIYHRLQDEHAF